MKNNNAKRVTLYLQEEELNYIQHLKNAFEEEMEFYPDLSQNKWIKLLLQEGQHAIVKRIESIREI